MDPRTLAKKPQDKRQFKTVVAVNVHDDFLSRSVLSNHFSKFGTVVDLRIFKKNKSASVTFSKASEAKSAKENGSVIHPSKPPLKMFFSERGGAETKTKSTVRTLNTASKSVIKPVTKKITEYLTPVAPPKKTVHALEKAPPAEAPSVFLSLYSDSTESQELFSRKANTAEERYRLLEARDKFIRAKKPKVKMRVEFAEKLVGTCQDMCPEKERYMREAQRQLTSFEMAVGRDNEVDHRLAIKAYSRSSADQEEPLPHELRPTETLEMSLLYLLHNIIPKEEHIDDLANWYNFVWDRTRSIRKDITQQQLHDLRAVNLMEKCTRFHIHCSSRLCELDRHAFDAKLNDENLMKCLQSLEHMYTDLNLVGVVCPNEPEFRAYQILMNLNEGDILWEIQQKPPRVLTSNQVQFAISIHMAVFEKNYALFFKLVRKAPYLTACILHRYFFQVRSGALRTIFKAYSMHNKAENYTSFSAISRSLGFSPDDTELFPFFCSSHGVTCEKEKDRIILNKKTFEMPDFPSITREHYLIESKLHQPLNVEINGGPLDANPYPSHCPRTSFNEQGYLIPGDLVGVPEQRLTGKSETFARPKPPEVPKPRLEPKSDVPGAQKLATFSWTLPSSKAASPNPFATREDKKPVFARSNVSFPNSTPFGGRVGSEAPVQAATPSFRMEAPFGIFGGGQPTSSFGGGQSSSSFASGSAPSFPALPRGTIFGGPRAPAKPARNQEVSRISDNIWNNIFSKTLRNVCQRALQDHQQAVHKRKALIARAAQSIYTTLERTHIENEIRMFYSRRRQVQLVVNRKCLQSCEKLLNDIVDKSVARICYLRYNEEVQARERQFCRLVEIMRRLQIRFWVRKWKTYAQKKKREKQLRLENKRKELENFPSYQNTYLVSPEQVLASWCGGFRKIPSRRSLNSLLSVQMNSSGASTTVNRENLPPARISPPAISQKLMGEDAVRKMLELFDFPASSNVNHTTSAAMLSSWCHVSSNASIAEQDGIHESKKLRFE